MGVRLFRRMAVMVPMLCAVACTAMAANSTSKPWTFWYWMYGAVSKPGIQADLKAMKDVGLGGCYLMPIRGVEEKPEYLGKALQLTPEFWEMADYAMQQCDSLDLELGIHICDGFALAGGPWISPEESMQKVVWSDTIIHVTKHQQHITLPQAAEGYQGYYEDIAAFACPVSGDGIAPLPIVSGTILPDENGTYRSKEPGYIQYSYEQPQTVRSIEIIPSGNNVQSQRLLVQVSDDGEIFHDVRQLTPPRQGWQNTDQNYTYALPETTARYFRFVWTPEGTPPGAEDMDAAKWSPVLKVKDIRLSAEPCIDQYESKNGSVWRIAGTAVAARPLGACYPLGSVASLVEERDARNSSLPTLPPGRWRIVRFGHTSTGHTNATAGGAKGLECDKFSIAAVEKQVSNWFGAFMRRPHSSVVKYMHVDSWECGSQNWSRNFAKEFKQRRGYDLLSFMPVYAGIPIDEMDEAKTLHLTSEQVLHDIRQTISNLICEVFFATVAQLAHDYGVQLSAESVAPTMVSDGMAHYQYADQPMGEYWLNSPTHDKPNDMLDAISAAHVYGKPIVQAECFTEVRGVWDETPADIKPLLDRNFALGMNRLFFHVFTHNPWTDRKPGMTLDGIGLFFQRDQTWFPEARGLVEYATRCSELLQQGRPVADIAVYTGEELPRRAFTPDRLVPILPGLFGSERVASEQRRLANKGCPMEESPVGVKHTAGILDLKDWVNPMHGYQYDSMNKDALLHQPFHYQVLVIPDTATLSPEVRTRIDSLRLQGTRIIDKPYTATQLDGLAPDVVLPDGIGFAHRTTDQEDIYFLTNQTAKTVSFKPVFRTDCQDSYIYRPLNNRTEDYDNGVITMNPYEAFFIIGRHPSTLSPVASLPNRSLLAIASHPSPPSLRSPIAPSSRLPLPLEKDRGKHSLWQVTFLESGITLHTDTLFDWSQYHDPRIRFFSGHARYATTFKISKNIKNEKINSSSLHTPNFSLCLGNIRDVAHVWVNGIDCGIAWTAPYEVDITHALRKGKNTLEIEIVNTWHNALRGADRGTPPYDGIWTNAKYRTKGNGLLPAGLLEPPVLRIDNLKK